MTDRPVLLPCGPTPDPAPRPTHIATYLTAKTETDPLVVEIADMLWRIEGNYHREGSGPGSRFEGRMLESVQAEAVIRHVRWHDQAEREAHGGPARTALRPADAEAHSPEETR